MDFRRGFTNKTDVRRLYRAGFATKAVVIWAPSVIEEGDPVPEIRLSAENKIIGAESRV